MQISVAVVGSHGVGKTELISKMEKYKYFTFEEYLINSDNVKHHDFFIFVIDVSKDLDSQLQCINSQLNNFIIVATKVNTDFEKDKLIELEKDILGKEVNTFYEWNIVEILSYVMKAYCNSIEELSKKLLSRLSEEQISKINMFIILFMNQDEIVKNVLSKIISKHHCIPDFIPSFQREYQDE